MKNFLRKIKLSEGVEMELETEQLTFLKGWEEKDEVQSFKLIKVDGKRLYFDGFTFEKVNDKEINIYGLIHQGDTTEEVKFNYKKQ